VKRTIVTVRKVTRVKRVTRTTTVSVAASSRNNKRNYDEPAVLAEPDFEDGWTAGDTELEGRNVEEAEAGNIEDRERSEEHDLEPRQGRNLCPVCPKRAVVSSGKTDGMNNVVYCCPAVKVGS
jgi:hypothetical protein